MPTNWTAESILALARSFQPMCVLAAAADLELFAAFSGRPATAPEIADRIRADLRGTSTLLDALAALDLLLKQNGRYTPAPGAEHLLTPDHPGSVLAMAQHQANCLRRWTRLAETVKSGQPARREPSVRGETADQAAFIGAMNDLSAPLADVLVGDLPDFQPSHILDLGGASGTWTAAFLRRYPQARATIFDLPHVLPLASQAMRQTGLLDRILLVAGDFLTDDLPGGADLCWISAIIHQNSRAQNRRLFAAVHRALATGGRVLIRDVVMDESRTTPVAGALFAINMLVGTDGGGTFTLGEVRADLEAAGFNNVALRRKDEWMNSIISAEKPIIP
jgi:hypothetical protein